MLQSIPVLSPGEAARCLRCRHTLAVDKPDSLERTLSLTVAAAIVFLIANVWPLMGLSAVGRHASTTILGGAQEMWLQGNEITAVLVAFCTVIAPAIHIVFMLTVLLAVRRPPAPSWVGMLLRWLEWQYPWAMIEVMMLGILVALIKIAELATVIPGVGMFAVGALMALFATMKVSFDPREVWTRIRWANGEAPAPAASTELNPFDGDGAMSNGILTGMKLGLISCEACGLLSRPADIDEPGHCPRCGNELSLRRKNAIQRTWAFILAAAICYIPANILPVLNTITVTSTEDDTILDGVVLLYTTGSWPLALIVLIASVVIPLGKLIALSYLLLSVQRRSIVGSHERVRLYRLVEIVGRWSMLDVFVDTFTVALIQLQPLMSVKPGPGVIFFAAVVVLTMIAAQTFDPRLIWDAGEGKEGSYD